ISIYFTMFSPSKSDLNFIDSWSVSNDENEKKEVPNGGEPSGTVFNALDAMLKGSLDRLKTMKFALLILPDFHEMGYLTRNYLLNALCKSGDLGRAEWLVREMLCQGPSRTCATYNTLTNGYCLVNKMDEALDLFSTMASHGIRPNRVLCNILQIISHMLENSIIPKHLIWNVIIDAYLQCGDVQRAFSVKNLMVEFGAHYLKTEMLSKGLFPDIITCNLLIGAACNLGLINIITYTELLKCYCIRGNMKQAEELFFKVLGSGLSIDHVPFLILMKKYFRMRELGKVFKLYLIWSRRGI
ncbi:hypothetical protein Pfo_030108, partial [Paulownia fortunei]